MSEVRELLDRADAEGMTKGLAYRIARASCDDGYNVCVRCGWPWISASNRCVNRECGGFCTWGERYEGEPTSWVTHPDDANLPVAERRLRPRAPGEAVDRPLPIPLRDAHRR